MNKIKIKKSEFELNDTGRYLLYRLNRDAFEKRFCVDASKLVLESDDLRFEIFTYIDADFDEFSVDKDYIHLVSSDTSSDEIKIKKIE